LKRENKEKSEHLKHKKKNKRELTKGPQYLWGPMEKNEFTEAFA